MGIEATTIANLLDGVSIAAFVVQIPAASAASPAYQFSVDPLTITLIGGMIVTVISALVAGVVSIVTAIRIQAVAGQTVRTSERLITVAADTEAIKGHVNSEKTAAQGRETALQQENRMLREMIADKANTAALLAQSTAGHARVIAAAASGPLAVEIVNPAPVPVVETGGQP